MVHWPGYLCYVLDDWLGPRRLVAGKSSLNGAADEGSGASKHDCGDAPDSNACRAQRAGRGSGGGAPARNMLGHPRCPALLLVRQLRAIPLCAGGWRASLAEGVAFQVRGSHALLVPCRLAECAYDDLVDIARADIARVRCHVSAPPGQHASRHCQSQVGTCVWAHNPCGVGWMQPTICKSEGGWAGRHGWLARMNSFQVSMGRQSRYSLASNPSPNGGGQLPEAQTNSGCLTWFYHTLPLGGSGPP